MLIDELKIYARAGKGGNGVVRWRREKYKPLMGPAGGNGGKGADVYIRAIRDIEVLSRYTKNKKFTAENGGNGEKNSMHGKNGDDLFIDLPVGSIVKNLATDEKFELIKEDESILVLRGGHGGLGNENFKSSKNTSPEESTEGKKGEDAEFFIELELIADAGLIGLPSAGKSSLLNELTRANAKVGAYPFTTLEPNLGELYKYILADIPGLIEGASEGKGLGHKFLRHIKRTKLLLHCISLENEDVVKAYKTIKNELKKFDSELDEKSEIIILTKTDLVDDKTTKKAEEKLRKYCENVVSASVYDDKSLKSLSDFLVKKLTDLYR
ncbi:MAG: Obg family GTPase CgtA [Candidatus Pacebacteria bacterium]|nr:Obg family GTPase CgtA [Candidatus Paceibacterota bacterium]